MINRWYKLLIENQNSRENKYQKSPQLPQTVIYVMPLRINAVSRVLGHT
jgi:hypothetical protein